MFRIRSGVHPPAFHLDHTLSDWPECRLEVRCQGCGNVCYIPVRLIRGAHGDRTFRATLSALKCGACGGRPAPVYLLAGERREHCWGASPGWAIELVAKP